MYNNFIISMLRTFVLWLGKVLNLGWQSGLPLNLVLVRHGESEGNVAVHLSKHNDDSAFTELFRERHSKTWKLTDKGIFQAVTAGDWLRRNNLFKFDHYYVSTYDRAKQTAAYLQLPYAEWHRPKVVLRERDRGRLDVSTVRNIDENHPEVRKGEEQEPYLYRYPGGESLADVELRCRHFFRTLEREAAREDVIMVSHGEVMWTMMMLAEGLSLSEFMELNKSKADFNRIHNCQIIQYSRVDFETGEITPYFSCRRSVCPWDTSKSTNKWERIKRVRMSNEDLLATVGTSGDEEL